MGSFGGSIWIFNAVLQWGLLALILLRSRWRQHLAFAVYIAFCTCKTSLLIWVNAYQPKSYFSVNWFARLIGLPLLIAVFIEVFSSVFQPYTTLPKGTLRWFRVAFSLLVFLSAAVAIFSPGAGPWNMRNAVLVLNRSASIIFCGAFAFTALFSSYFGIPWQHRTYGIGAGFLLFMSVDLFTSSLLAIYSGSVGFAIRNVAMLGYTLALITWLYHFGKPDVPSHTPTLEQLRRLQKALDYNAQKAESFRETF